MTDPDLTDQHLWELVKVAKVELQMATTALRLPEAKLDLSTRSDLRDRVAELSLNLLRLENRCRRSTAFGAL